MKANKIGIVILLLTQRLCWFTEDLFSLLDRDEPLPFCANLKAGAPQWSARFVTSGSPHEVSLSLPPTWPIALRGP